MATISQTNLQISKTMLLLWKILFIRENKEKTRENYNRICKIIVDSLNSSYLGLKFNLTNIIVQIKLDGKQR